MAYANKGLISPRYIVSSLGDGNYDAVDGTSDEDQINLAINNLTPNRTWPEMVLLKGNLVIDGPIVVPAYTHIENTGRVYLDDGSDCNMLENANPASTDVECTIEGGMWDGNRDNNAAGDIIYWEHSAGVVSAYHKWVHFKNMELIAASEVGLHIDSESSSNSNYEISNVWGRFADTYSFHFEHVSDFYFTDSQTEGDSGTMFHECGISLIDSVYFNQGAIFDGGGVNHMSNCHFDIGQNVDGLYLDTTHDNIFTDLIFNIVGNSGFVGNSAIYLTGSDQNMITGVKAGRFHQDQENNRWNYVIEEDATCNGNMYKDIDPAGLVDTTDYVTAVAYIQDVDVQLDFISVPFLLNRGGATEADHGIDVSGGGEHAVANVNLPPSVNQLVWIVIDAYIGAAPGAGDTMEIDLRVNAASDIQPWQTHTTTLANLGSTGTNYLVGDVGYWRTLANDSAGILALMGGDSVQIDVYHEVGSGDEASTNAEFRSATLWYV